MSVQRIRYSKVNEFKQISVKTFNHPTNGARYQSILDSKENQWMIIDSESGLVACSGYMVSAHKQKIEAKKALVELGIEFTTEDRFVKSKSTVDPINEQADKDYRNDMAMSSLEEQELDVEKVGS